MLRFQTGSRYAGRLRVVVTIDVTNVVTVVVTNAGTVRKNGPLHLTEGNVFGEGGWRESAGYEAEARAFGGAPGPLITRLSELR
jgi:hypothetical protein